MTTQPPIDRFLIAAVTDRLIYDSETAFDPDDARQLLAAMPRRRPRRFGFGIAGTRAGGSTRGFAAGIGSTEVEDDKRRSFEYHTDADDWVRAGQWKLMWSRDRAGMFIEIEQVMADPFDDGRGARVRYGFDGTPVGMEIQTPRVLRLFMIAIEIAGWKPWKTPAPIPV